MEKNISVLMSVYKNNEPQHVIESVESVINQTLPPKQIVMVVDGPVPDELRQTLEDLENKYDIYENIWLKENLGTGGALKDNWEKCKYEYIAKMDSDDISVPDRFEKEMKFLEEHPDVDVVGGLAQEFYDEVGNWVGIKYAKETHEETVEFMKSRCMLINPTLIMKREIIEKAGGYQPWHYAEDWYLFIRMYLAGARFYNLQEVLLYVRLEKNTFSRRHGLKYYKSIKGLLKFMYKKKIIGFFRYTKEKIIRFIGHVLVPDKLMNGLYRKFLRR